MSRYYYPIFLMKLLRVYFSFLKSFIIKQSKNIYFIFSAKEFMEKGSLKVHQKGALLKNYQEIDSKKSKNDSDNLHQSTCSKDYLWQIKNYLEDSVSKMIKTHKILFNIKALIIIMYLPIIKAFNIKEDFRPTHFNIKPQTLENSQNLLTQQCFEHQNQLFQEHIKREPDIYPYQNYIQEEFDALFPSPNENSQLQGTADFGRNFIPQSIISFNQQEINKEPLQQEEDIRKTNLIQIFSQKNLLRESPQFRLTNGIVSWIRDIYFSGQLNCVLQRQHEELLNTIISRSPDYYTLSLLDQPLETTQELFRKAHHLPSKITFYIRRSYFTKAEKEKLEIILKFYNLAEYLNFQEYFEQKGIDLLLDERYNKAKEILKIFVQILKSNNVKCTVLSEIETIMLDISKCSFNVMRRIALNASQFCEMTVILDLGRNHSLEILRIIISILQNQRNKCKRVVFRIDDCSEEEIMDYLMFIQQSEIKPGTLVLDVLGRNTLRIKMESLILEVIDKDLIRMCANLANSKSTQCLFEGEQTKEWKLFTEIQINLQKYSRINERSMEKQDQEFMRAVETKTQKGVIEGLEAILSNTMQFYGSTSVEIIDNQAKKLEISVSGRIETNKENKEILRIILSSLMMELLGNSLNNKLTFQTFDYQYLKETDSSQILEILSQLKDLKKIKLQTYYEEVTIDRSQGELFSTLFSFRPNQQLTISVLKWPVQTAYLTLIDVEASNGLAQIFLQLSKIDCLRIVCFNIRFENAHQIGKKADKICNLIIAGVSTQKLTKLSVSCTEKNLANVFYFEFDRLNKKVCLTFSEYSLSVIDLLRQADIKSYSIEVENLRLILDQNFLINKKNYAISKNGKIKTDLFEIRLTVEQNFNKSKNDKIMLLDYHFLSHQLLLDVILQLNKFNQIALDVPNLDLFPFDCSQTFKGFSKIYSITINEPVYLLPSFFSSIVAKFPSLLNLSIKKITNQDGIQCYFHMNKFLNLKKVLMKLLAAKQIWPVSRVETLFEIFLKFLL